MRIVRDMPTDEFFEKEEGILSAHWNQIAANKEVIKLSPDKDKYKLLQQVGALRNIIVMDGDKIAGYSVILIQPHLHYKEDLFAFVDVIFVREEYRNTKAGLLLIKETEALSKEAGVSLLTYHTKPEHNQIEKILIRKDYSHIENIFGKMLKG